MTEAAAEENKGDEYEHDSSDEEVRPGVLLGSFIFHLFVQVSNAGSFLDQE